MQQQDEHPALSAGDLKAIRRAVKCPNKLIKSDAEAVFIKETADRLERFKEGIYLSEKQLAWLHRIAGRMDGNSAKKPATGKAKSELADDLPNYDELAGE